MGKKNKVGPELHYYSERLKQKLNKIRFVGVAAVEAPAGYGKTTAIRDFLEAELPQTTPVYWFTAIDEAPAASFRRLCYEIEKIDHCAGERLQKIGLPNAVNIGEACDVVRRIECRTETYLVIDNFQFLQNAMHTSFFNALIEHRGEGLHIIIISQMLKRGMVAIIVGHGIVHITASDLRHLSVNACCVQEIIAGMKVKLPRPWAFTYKAGIMIGCSLSTCLT